MASTPALANSAGMLVTPADVPIFGALTAYTSSCRIGRCSSSGVCGITIRLNYSIVILSQCVFFFNVFMLRTICKISVYVICYPHKIRIYYYIIISSITVKALLLLLVCPGRIF